MLIIDTKIRLWRKHFLNLSYSMDFWEIDESDQTQILSTDNTEISIFSQLLAFVPIPLNKNVKSSSVQNIWSKILADDGLKFLFVLRIRYCKKMMYTRLYIFLKIFLTIAVICPLHRLILENQIRLPRTFLPCPDQISKETRQITGWNNCRNSCLSKGKKLHEPTDRAVLSLLSVGGG